MGRVQFGLAFVLRGGNTPFLGTNMQFASMIVNVVLKIEFFWTLQKKLKTPKCKCNSSVEKCSS